MNNILNIIQFLLVIGFILPAMSMILWYTGLINIRVYYKRGLAMWLSIIKCLYTGWYIYIKYYFEGGE